MAADQAHSGTQSIERAFSVLRFLASCGSGRARLGEVAAGVELNKATAHRLLSALVREGLVEKDEENRHYQLGLQVLALVPNGGHRFAIQRLAEPSLRRLSERTGDTAYLTIRSGMDGLCLDRVSGGQLVQSQILCVGSRWPLGVGAGSLALLAALPDSEVEAVVACGREGYGRFGPHFSSEAMMEAVEETRANGFALNDGRIVGGLVGLGVAVGGEDGAPAAALSLASGRERMPPERRPELVDLLREEAALLEARLRPGRGARAAPRRASPRAARGAAPASAA
jgi:DNA-binding IclR family transcriptional regulator